MQFLEIVKSYASDFNFNSITSENQPFKASTLLCQPALSLSEAVACSHDPYASFALSFSTELQQVVPGCPTFTFDQMPETVL